MDQVLELLWVAIMQSLRILKCQWSIQYSWCQSSSKLALKRLCNHKCQTSSALVALYASDVREPQPSTKSYSRRYNLDISEEEEPGQPTMQVSASS